MLRAAFSYTSYDRTVARGDEKFFCALDCHIAYSVENVERMKTIGGATANASGVIEAGCKTVLGRLKRSAMFWTVWGADAIIALRCCQLGGRFKDYWQARRA